MFVLDTNVISALALREPPPAVSAWVAQHPLRDLFTTAVCQWEVLSGLAIMPRSRRRTQVAAHAADTFQNDFAGRILPFDSAAAEAYGEIFALRRSAGRPTFAVADLMIAAIARVHAAAVVTRNTADFEDCGIDLVNPWLA